MRRFDDDGMQPCHTGHASGCHRMISAAFASTQLPSSDFDLAGGPLPDQSETGRHLQRHASRMKERCKHDGACYRVNPDHWSRFRHDLQEEPLPR